MHVFCQNPSEDSHGGNMSPWVSAPVDSIHSLVLANLPTRKTFFFCTYVACHVALEFIESWKVLFRVMRLYQFSCDTVYSLYPSLVYTHCGRSNPHYCPSSWPKIPIKSPFCLVNPHESPSCPFFLAGLLPEHQGGYLVYATCSLCQRQNEDVARPSMHSTKTVMVAWAIKTY